ncbi:metal-dependent hydrolase [Erythrobacter aquimaris]|uniref:Metal-dependent hydrolase n=1 Tax=Qipengyuania aquimaris TaxID=255984 RepID=A0A6I4TI70_9SPHN|nr:metal-dependent hydrolase [Qipengyuania aquimaris]MXO95564.1 metal-dependent hydrolase [Qipengyuania aquimaris]
MDNLTHSLVGALIGQAGLKKKTGLAMPALIIGANLPDVDAACLFWLEGVEHLGFRRGITHGPPALVMLPLILAGLLYAYDKWQAGRGKRPAARLPVSFKWLFLLSFIGCLTHPALDWLNVYGIRLLEPFSSQWFYGDTLFIIDIWLWVLLGFATWFSLRREKRGGEWKQPAKLALSIAGIYIALQGFITGNAERGVTGSPTGTEIVIASPPPLWSWKRDMITGGNGLYTLGEDTTFPGVPLDRCDLERARASDSQIDAFLFWARTPYIVPEEDGTLWLRDARFSDPRATGRFEVRLPSDICEGVKTELSGGNSG